MGISVNTIGYLVINSLKNWDNRFVTKKR
jgi:hypothetical protein